MIEPTIEALTTSCSPSPSAKRAMMSSGALPKVTLSRPPMPGPAARGELLGRAAHQRGRRDDAERADAKQDDRAGVRELEHDRDRDERDQQVRPAVGRQQERERTALLGDVSGHGRERICAAEGGAAAGSAEQRGAGLRLGQVVARGLHALVVRLARRARARRRPARRRRRSPCCARCCPSTASAAVSSESGRGSSGGEISCGLLSPATARSSATVPSFCVGVSTSSLIVMRRSWWSCSPVQMSTPALWTALATAPWASPPMPAGRPAIAFSPVPPVLDRSLSRSFTRPSRSTSALRWTTFSPSIVSTPSSWTLRIQPRGSTPSVPMLARGAALGPGGLRAELLELAGRQRERARPELHPAGLAGRDDADREAPVLRRERDVEVELRRPLARSCARTARRGGRSAARAGRRCRRRARRCRASAARCRRARPCRTCRSGASRCPRPSRRRRSRSRRGPATARSVSARSGSRRRRRIGGCKPDCDRRADPDRSIGIVPRHPVALPVLMLALLALPGAARASAPDVLVLDARGQIRLQQDAFLPAERASELPPPGLVTPPPAGAAAGGRALVRATVPSRLRALERSGQLSAEDARDYTAAYAARAQDREAAEGQPARRARRGAAQRRGAGLRRAPHRLAGEGRPDDRQAQRAVVGRERPARPTGGGSASTAAAWSGSPTPGRACRSSGSGRSGA